MIKQLPDEEPVVRQITSGLKWVPAGDVVFVCSAKPLVLPTEADD